MLLAKDRGGGAEGERRGRQGVSKRSTGCTHQVLGQVEGAGLPPRNRAVLARAEDERQEVIVGRLLEDGKVVVLGQQLVRRGRLRRRRWR